MEIDTDLQVLTFDNINTLTMKLIINLLLLAIAIPVFAQKKLVDIETPKNWEKLETYQISDNGKFVWYKQRSPAQGIKVTLTSSDGKFKRIFKDGNQAKFIQGGNYFICNYYGKDSTGIIDFDTKLEFVLKGRNYSTSKSKNGDLIACESDRQLILMNLKSGDKHIYTNINRFGFSPDGSTLMLTRQTNERNFLVSINLSTYDEHIICEANVGNWCFDLANKVFVYQTQDSTGNLLWVYSLTNKSNKQVPMSSFDKGTKISDGLLNVSPDGKILYFEIEKPLRQPQPNVITEQLNVWSYTDEYPKSTQSLIKTIGPSGAAQTVAYSMLTSRMVTLTDDSLKLFEHGKFSRRYMLLVNQINDDESYYKGHIRKLFLMDIETREKKLIAVSTMRNIPVLLTADEKYVVWYDEAAHKYFSYETQSGVKRDLSVGIDYSLDTFNEAKRSRAFNKPYQFSLVQVGGSQSERLIIGDKFDLWEVDFTGRKKPFCLTGGIGRQQGIQYRVVVGTTSVFVEAFDTRNKNKGVFSLAMNNRSELKLKEIAPMQASYFSGHFLPQRAASTEIFLLTQEKANKSVNLYLYNNANCLKITDFHQEEDFNWFTSELHTYKLADGSTMNGILYKPENFNPSIKYPVIFYYYELNSQTLNVFIEPTQSQGTLPIPLYVSNGYLVFVPDVTHQQPNPGDRIVDCITSAAKYVAKLPFVDAKYMGLQGHSYGGYETNLMITKSTLFTAAQSSAGLSNITSMYLLPFHSRRPGYSFAEFGQLNMPRTLWNHKDLYMNDSPIFDANKITTPLLMMHGKKDGAVPIEQSLEMYFALRRLNKQVWMLEYEDEGHSLENEKNMLDFTIRQQQFFDHYLKGKSKPVWMSRGIPSWEKGIKSGLELDTAEETR
jgi:predicted peptidase